MREFRLLKIVVCLAAGTWFQSCQSPENTTLSSKKNYLDLKGYFENEIATLQKQKPLVKKTVVKDGENSTKVLKDIDWNKELALFVESDINKPAWQKSYSIDSVIISNNEVRWVYAATDEKLTIRRIELTQQSGRIHEVKIFNHTSNNLYSSFQLLHYTPKHGYKIIGEQAVKVIGKTSYAIVVRMRNTN